jgi:protein phosphatase methylesterase 1
MEPIPWTTFFERELFLPDPATGRNFHAYFTSPVGKGPLFVMHHGAGSSGLSFAALAMEIRKRVPAAGILSPDARYHGSTSMPADEAMDLTLEALTADLVFVVQATQAQMRWSELPPIVMVGHSLGGAVVTQAANTATAATAATVGSAPLGTSLLGYVVLDVVEGSAMDALQSMMTYLSTRPSGFASVQSGIDWHVRSRTVRNSTSARTSVPSLLVHVGDNAGLVDPTSGRPWRWRTDLAATQPFWEGWFVGLSKKFLGGRGGKMLLLAGTDRLDTELTIGQMQGRLS